MKKTSFLSRAGIIAAIYAVLTLAVPFIGFGPIQFRISEAMCVLPLFFPESVLGLFIGCLVSNSVGMAFGMTTPWDILIGSLATLIAAIITRKIKQDLLVPLPSVLVNALMIGTMLTFVIMPEFKLVPLLYNILTVGLGQFLSCYLLGIPLLKILKKRFK
ncbi:MAG: QueT transporter family protein [Clostridia bacterium]|nr:QueT transporter family protein [Clostridia bacterium]